MFTEDKSTLAIRLVEGGQILKFMSGEAEAIMRATNSVISNWQNQQPVSTASVTVHYSTLQYTTVHYSTLQYTPVHYSTLQYTTVQYTTVQYTTVQYSIPQYM